MLFRSYLNTYDSRTSDFMFLHPPLPIDETTQKSGIRKDDEFICTDLISETYHSLGVFANLDSSLWPRDFYTNTQNLALTPEWSFGPETRLSRLTPNVR